MHSTITYNSTNPTKKLIFSNEENLQVAVPLFPDI